jgi:hypothetical protein
VKQSCLPSNTLKGKNEMTLSDEQKDALNRACPALASAMLGDAVVELQEGGGGGSTQEEIDVIWQGGSYPSIVQIVGMAVYIASDAELTTPPVVMPYTGEGDETWPCGVVSALQEGKENVDDGDTIKVRPFNTNNIVEVLPAGFGTPEGSWSENTLLTVGIDSQGNLGACESCSSSNTPATVFLIGRALEDAKYPDEPAPGIGGLPTKIQCIAPTVYGGGAMSAAHTWIEVPV